MHLRHISRVIVGAGLLWLHGPTAEAQSVTLAWDANTEPDLAGYVVLYGTTSREYTQKIDVGNETQFTVSRLTVGRRYYFAVQAYSALDVRSDLSVEVSAVVQEDGSTSTVPGESESPDETVPIIPDFPADSPEDESAPPLPLPTGAPAPSATMYLAEGATGQFFDLDITLANFATTVAPVTLQFLKENGTTIERTLELAPQSQRIVRVNEIPGLEASAVSTTIKATAAVVVERTMFWDQTRYGGHGTSGVTARSNRWYFAEGSQGFFDTYLLLANPNTTSAIVSVFFLRENTTPIVRNVRVNPMSRLTIFTGSIPSLVGRSFSMIVSSSVAIVAERSMYFGKTQFWAGGHESAGVTRPSTTWFHAEGATGPYFDCFILIGNPGSKRANLTVTYLLDNGTPIVKTYSVGAYQRLTIDVESQDPRLANAAVSTTVTSDVPIVSERAMYWPGSAATWTEAHNSFGVTRATTKWGLSEGRVGGSEGFETYILLANPGKTVADVRVTFVRPAGAPIVKTFSVPATSRYNVNVNAVVPELTGQTFGAVIESINGAPIVVERAMYWSPLGPPSALSQSWAGGTNVVAVPLP
jgi:hypothetical protein